MALKKTILYFATFSILATNAVFSKPRNHPKRATVSQKQKLEPTPISIGILDLSKTSDLWNLTMQLKAFAKSDDIKAILIKAYGSGDSLGFAYTLFREIQHAQKTKPVIALVEDQCLEECYYVIASADCIIASPTAMVGLIGSQLVITRYENLKIKDNRRTADLNVTTLYKGAFKTVLDPNAPALSDEQKTYLESILEELYDQFCQDVADARNIDYAQRDTWADGKHFTARRASQKDIKLVDKLGSYSDALELIRGMLKARGFPYTGELVPVVVDQQETRKE